MDDTKASPLLHFFLNRQISHRGKKIICCKKNTQGGIIPGQSH